MKYLRNFETEQEAVSFANNFDGNYGVLLSCDEIPVPLIIEESGSDIPANDEIWYTTSTGMVLPNDRVDTNAIYQTKEDFQNRTNHLTLISNTYRNGKGILKFDRSVGALSSDVIHHNFDDEQYVTSVVLPESFVYAICDAFNSVNSAQITSYGTIEGYDWKIPPT